MRLTLPVIAPPLPDVDGLSDKWTGLVVMCPFAYDRYIEWEVEHDEGELSQVDLMNLLEDLLPQPRIQCFPFLLVEGIQGMIAIVSWVLITCEKRVVGIIGTRISVNFGDVKAARYGSRWR